jgi:outer membrane lipoprotein-sorting protein
MNTGGSEMKRLVRIGALGLAAAVAVGFHWKAAPPKPRIDSKALAMLKEAEALVQNATSISAQLVTTNSYGGPYTTESEYTIQLRKPNLVRMVEKRTGRGVDTAGKPTVHVSNAQTLHDGTLRYDITDKTCEKRPLPVINESRELSHFQNSLYWTFFDLGEWQFRSHLGGLWHTTFNLRDPGLKSIEYSGEATVDGVKYDVVTWTYKNRMNLPEDDHLYTTKFFIGGDKLIHRVESSGEDNKSTQVYTNLKLNDPAVTAEIFGYTPPTDVACKDEDPEAVYKSDGDLPVGSQAPDFVAKDAMGRNVRFYDLIKGKKAVLLDFTAYG